MTAHCPRHTVGGAAVRCVSRAPRGPHTLSPKTRVPLITSAPGGGGGQGFQAPPL